MRQEQLRELLTVREAADFLRVKVSTIRAWILQRRVVYVKVGGRVLLRRSDLEKLIESGIVPAKATS
jgi:excisionase family DNA binding protein